jgi:hypothetical protein
MFIEMKSVILYKLSSNNVFCLSSTKARKSVIKNMLADAGIPMLPLIMPVMIVLIIPVIIIEYACRRKLIKVVRRRRIWRGIEAANIFSTFIGWPIAWGLHLILEIVTGYTTPQNVDTPLQRLGVVTLQAPWLGLYKEDTNWIFPTAMGVLLIPFFFVSVFSERFILMKMWKEEEKVDIVRFSWRSNICSYAFLYLLVAVLGIYEMSQ